ncbi:5-dehydro-4-deoxyglucarate dehydratase [Rhodococcus rhodochrous]|uniref:5-dehydro-4-deoxyglucarate dehydratase n=1 Tax=Rhodococcus rhodochrous TaxID=1829 RepID=UPI0006C8DD1F|nr:5-dehydro-4-deoxyglucarate dehydratase [Rhodococcus rhodochrous]
MSHSVHKYFSIDEGSLLGFPITPYDRMGRIDQDALAQHIEMLLSYGAKAVFAACGTGEMQCLSTDEHDLVIATTVSAVAGRVPVLSAAGFGLHQSIEMIDRAAAAGVDGVLAFPPYMTGSDDESLYGYYAALAGRSKLPLIIYQRDAVLFSPEVLAALGHLPNVVGLKDGTGLVDVVQQQIRAVDDPQFVYFNGTPTAELYVPSMVKAGIASYSSALLNVVPEFAEAFNQAFVAGHTTLQRRLIDDVVIPFIELRNRRAGYAVALVKEGINLRGRSVGPVRPPLLPVTAKDRDDLQSWLNRIGLDGELKPKSQNTEPWSLPTADARA